MADYTFTINGESRSVEDVPEWLPMLWVLRDKLGITGPKYGCGIGACRACTCHISDGNGGFTEFQPCITPASDIGDRPVRTIEGLADGDQLHPVQQAWLELDVPQCGFCQPGQIMTACALIANTDGEVTDDDIDQIENVCRCGTYARIRQAIKTAAANMAGNGRGRPDDTPGRDNHPGQGNQGPGRRPDAEEDDPDGGAEDLIDLDDTDQDTGGPFGRLLGR